MTKIDENLILKLEKLARLKLTDDERVEINQDLGKIVAMFDKLQEEEALKNAPKSLDGHIAVPKFLKPK